MSACQSTPAFCASMHDYTTTNGTVGSEFTYNNCIDFDKLRYARTDTVSTEQNMVSVYDPAVDGTSVFTFLVDPTTEEAIVGSCTYVTVPAPLTALDLPFSFLLVDDAAVWEKEEAFAGLTCDVLLDHRVAVGTDQWMRWFMANRTDGDKLPELAATECTQMYDKQPGDGGNATVVVGTRNFTKDWNAEAAADDSLFRVPSAAGDCAPALLSQPLEWPTW